MSYNPFPVTWSPKSDAEFQLRESSRVVFGDMLPSWYEKTIKEGSAT